MYIRVGRRIINTDNLVDAEVYEAGEALSPHRAEYAERRTVVLTMVGVIADYQGLQGPRSIWLEGPDADAFLAALPVYEPVPEPEQSAAWMDGFRDGRKAVPYDEGYVDPDQATEEQKAEYLRAYEAGARASGRE